MNKKINIFWFRRDLRLNDNHGLFQALNSGLPVLPIFIFDTDILDKLPSKKDARVSFIYSELFKIKSKLERQGSSLKVFHSNPLQAFKLLIREFEINAVFINKDYEPGAIKRDAGIQAFLKGQKIKLYSFKDQVIFEEDEIVKDDNKPYTVFTPYSKKWKMALGKQQIPCYGSGKLMANFVNSKPLNFPGLNTLGFTNTDIVLPKKNISEKLLADYKKSRDFPAIQGTSKVGVHIRFGTISTRVLVRKTAKISETFLNELIWREFFKQILWHFPYVVNRAFKPKYNFIPWRNNEHEFDKWCKGETGYPMVDAGMRELNQTGFMHNRVRMITASFLSKHLLIDWRWGEAYFAEKLLDFELASNNGNWQWAAGCGCDAAPYFRVFSPEAQQKKFDPELKYINRWIPELNTFDYPSPIVEHKFARERALSVYKNALNQ